MDPVFLSYSAKDHFFAELAELKLAAEGIRVWRDSGQLRPGHEWRQGIEKGISERMAMLIALSAESSESPWITFELAYALGKGKPVLLLRLNDCKFHSKLEPIQYIDFSHPNSRPWLR
jgi:hypothetical protein